MEARLSLPTLHQWPLGTRQAPPLAIGDATLESYVGGDEEVIGGGETDGSCC